MVSIPADASINDRSNGTQARWLRLSVLFLLVSAGYVVWRGQNYIVWDDTSSSSFNRYSNHLHYSWSKPKFLASLTDEMFGHLQGDGYRPLSALYRASGAAWFSRETIEPLPFVVTDGLVIGLWSVVLWILARRFTKTDAGANLVVFLNMASVPVLTGCLVISSGIHAMVPLLICGGLVLYWNVKTSRRPWVWQMPLCLTLLVGPWFREFAGVTPLLILAAEALGLVGGRSWSVIVIALCGFAHALFPTALFHFAAYPDLPLLPVYRLGNLAGALERSSTDAGLWKSLQLLHWRIFGDIVSVLPPSLFVIALGSLVVGLMKREPRRPTRGVLFLWGFFALSFLPFLRTFHEQVHFAYCTMPISILLVLAVERLWIDTSALPWRRVALACALLVPLGDQAINIYAVRHVTDSIYAGIRRQAAWFTEHTPPGTVVICNAHHIEDIRFYSRGHIDPLATAGGIPDFSHWIPGPKELAVKLRDLKAPLYCLDAHLTADDQQRGTPRKNWVVRDEALDLEPVRAERMRCHYPFIDPLRLLLPTRNLCWPGPPDLEFDFYRGPIPGRTRLRQQFEFEVSLEYRLYAVKNLALRKYPANPVLLAQNVRGFNIVGYKNDVVAIPQSEGAFDPARVARCGYSRVFHGDSLDDVRHRVETASLTVTH
ncbi:MAG TPA: hypothetical protein VHX68_16215 [Planctomycetaceae bacterium]|nr:hypothetical protein [Planctomycetaceae bacterium]